LLAPVLYLRTEGKRGGAVCRKLFAGSDFGIEISAPTQC
jgi:hypothetical protein